MILNLQDRNDIKKIPFEVNSHGSWSYPIH
jgi:hypothetical protein